MDHCSQSQAPRGLASSSRGLLVRMIFSRRAVALANQRIHDTPNSAFPRPSTTLSDARCKLTSPFGASTIAAIPWPILRLHRQVATGTHWYFGPKVSWAHEVTPMATHCPSHLYILDLPSPHRLLSSLRPGLYSSIFTRLLLSLPGAPSTPPQWTPFRPTHLTAPTMPTN
jgi:hypothetical protein